MEENNNSMDQMGGGQQMGGSQKKGSGALVGSIIIIIIIIIGGIYMFRNAQEKNEGAMMNDEVVGELGNMEEGDAMEGIESDLENTNLDEVVPSTDEEGAMEEAAS